ncbi:hypothetical protein [Streptomyces sp. WZ-12]|uniref:hypothetical protein n=1 Tax=Streptomyces sp. WZ-12 TaxID=3030210 RepID=UPI0023816EB1|nr:hypothetical protein [Streptomyces sp. WZ-12]
MSSSPSSSSSSSSPLTYERVADVLQLAGMITHDEAQAARKEIGADGVELTPYDVALTLSMFGVAVSIHADDIDFLEESYASLLERAAEATGGAVTVSQVRLREGEPVEGFGYPDFNGRDDVLEFERNGELFSFSAEHFSEDYFDTAAAVEAVAACSPDDDPRAFHLVDFEREPHGIYDTVLALVSPEQARVLEEELGLEIPGSR